MMKFLLTVTLLWLILQNYHVYSYVHMCWHVNWSESRQNLPFTLENLETAVKMELCSHVIYSPAIINPETFDIEFMNNLNATNDIVKIVKLKEFQKDLKVFLAIGGWDIKSYGFNEAANPKDPNSMRLFSLQLINFLRKYSLDGVVIDFEFPNFKYSFSKPHTKTGFTYLLETMMNAFNEELAISNGTKLFLSAAVAARIDWIEDFYEASKIIKNLDYLVLLSFDLRNYFENITRITSALYPISSEEGLAATLNQVSAVEKWISLGARKNQIVLGIPSYGRSFELFNKSTNNVGAPIDGLGKAERVTNENGVLGYLEICQKLNDSKTIRKWQQENMNPYLIYENEKYWVGYEDSESIMIKMIFIRENDLAGAFLYSMDLDDFNGSYCGQGKFPLLKSIKNSLKSPLSLAQTSKANSLMDSKTILMLFIFLKFIKTLFKNM